MKYLFFVLHLFFCTFSFSQPKPVSLETKASDFQWVVKNYDSALHYYKVLNAAYPQYRSANIILQIGTCYKNLWKAAEAETNYLKCLSICESKGFSETEAYSAFYALYEIYYENKDYKKALLHLDYTKTKYKPVMRNCMGGFGDYYAMVHAYQRALCYEGLCLQDSIFSALAPYVFKPTSEFWGSDSITYIQASTLFVKSAVKVYGKATVAALLENAIKNSFYTIEYEKASENSFFAYVKCGFNFLGSTVQIGGNGYGVKSKGDLYDFMKKEFFLSQAKLSPAYKLISSEAFPSNSINGSAL